MTKAKASGFSERWYIWLFPVVALLITLGFTVDYFAERGPKIRLYFEDASGIQADKTTVRFRGLEVGLVKDLQLADKDRGVWAEVRLHKNADRFAVEGSKFFLVKPKVTFEGISGLETLVQGTYIAVRPGEGAAKSDFTAEASSTENETEHNHYIIQTPSAESFSVGNAVSYRGFRVGSINKIWLAKGAQAVALEIGVETRYTFLLRENTRFWRKVGVQASVGLFHANLKVNSVDSIVNGGLEFATPNNDGARVKVLHKYSLDPEAPKDLAKWSADMGEP